MLIRTFGRLLLVGACTISGLSVWGQALNESNSSGSRAVELGANFEAARANTVAGYSFWMEGGGVQVTRNVTRHWALAGDFARLHTGEMAHTTVGLDLITAVFGPRYSIIAPSGRFKIYGEAMGGAARGSNSIFPNPKGSTSSANGIALLIGGGVDYRISHHVYFRVLDANWLRTALSNGTTTVQNNLRLGSGLISRF